MNIDRNELDRYITGNWGEDGIVDQRFEARPIEYTTTDHQPHTWGVWDVEQERWCTVAEGRWHPARFEKERNARRAADALNQQHADKETE